MRRFDRVFQDVGEGGRLIQAEVARDLTASSRDAAENARGRIKPAVQDDCQLEVFVPLWAVLGGHLLKDLCSFGLLPNAKNIIQIIGRCELIGIDSNQISCAVIGRSGTAPNESQQNGKD